MNSIPLDKVGRFPRTTFEARFWRKVDSGPARDCWLWNSKLTHLRYGFLFINHKKVYAHRMAWMLINGPIPEGAWVCHKCNTPQCVNPNHLYLGDAITNSKDSWSRGTREGPTKGRKGERSPHHKLTQADVMEAKSLKAQGWTQTAIAKHFNVTQGAISRMMSGETW